MHPGLSEPACQDCRFGVVVHGKAWLHANLRLIAVALEMT